jgi:hypothetical protein
LACLTTAAQAQVCVPHQGNGSPPTQCCQTGGPDVIVGDIIDVSNYNFSGSVDAFALGTTSCNIGDQNLLWIASNNQHPVIGQNLYKLKDGVLEQVGQSWLKHGFTALAQNACGCGCNNPGTGSLLGIGCSDPYCCGLNGQQSNLGPKWQVNAFTGVYNYPPANPGFSGSVARRLQVKLADLEPSSASVLYFGECQYVTADDAQWGNQDNNVSHRQINVSNSGGSAGFSIAIAGTTRREQPAIKAWKLAHADVVETDVKVPNEGLMMLAARAIDNGDGTWRYEYALENINSHRSAYSYAVPVLPGTTVTSIGFHDVDYHSGDGGGSVTQDGTDWAATLAGGTCSWATAAYTVGNEFSANALRWGTMYNFRFIANAPPVTGNVTIGLFRPDANNPPGQPSVEVHSIVPSKPVIVCPADCADDNGTVDVADLLALLAQWDNDGPCDIDNNNVVDVADLLTLLAEWGDC